MKDLVFLKNKQALTTSLKVAEYFDKEHKHVVRDIRTLIQQMASQSQSPKLVDGVTTPTAQMFVESSYQAESGGRRYPMFYMNRDGFSLLAMGFTGAKALQFKLAYIEAFNAMEQQLLNWQNEQWRELRNATKISFKDLTPVIRELHEWATAHGCKVSEKVFFMNFFKLINKTLGINPNSRDTLAAWQLYEVDKLQFIARTIITGLLTQGADYHLPYRNCKDAFETYARLSYINQRLLNQ